ncbi:N-acetylglucosamine kinase [Microlunatus parietis]|uniref:N-acetylglucosamine kinase-like BadF-type ATPase n=1 Tax=Microlunatus parietis TaxID=682979 RepID=A0A7Y9I3M6_9ACTN|nr:BadF/BadG/BcrA/BcrD ATPase family protein [Microlunatus parietis]NYE69396.1 N-acetylglucosamine kinase-like BadF-type ATPase [Microlunatus parietis]
MRRWMAIDVGQTTVRVRTSWTSEVITAPGFHDPAADPVAAAFGAVRPILAAFAGSMIDDVPVVLAIGHTGLPEPAEGLDAVAKLILAELPVVSEVRLFPDAVTAHAGALSGRAGVVVAAGTGTVCLGVDSAGRAARVDGVGHLVGDAGSAYDLGRAGLRQAVWHQERREAASALYEAARRHLLDDLDLGDDLGASLRRLCWLPDRVKLVAAFARPVIDSAQAGDQVAARLVGQAAADLAATVRACAALIEPAAEDRRIACVGGMFASDALAQPFRAALDLADWRVVPADGTVLDGTVLLAGDSPGLHASLGHFRKGS